MEEQIFQLTLGAIALAGGAYVAWRYRHRVREKVAEWLRTNGLEKSALMEALIVCDTLAGVVNKQVVCKIFVKTQKTGEQQIFEESYSLDEFEKIDPNLHADFVKHGSARRNILEQIA